MVLLIDHHQRKRAEPLVRRRGTGPLIFEDDIVEMTPERRRKAIEEMIAAGYSREAAGETIAFAVGETDGDLVTDDQCASADAGPRRSDRRSRLQAGRFRAGGSEGNDGSRYAG
jgi:hypothetical protein